MKNKAQQQQQQQQRSSLELLVNEKEDIIKTPRSSHQVTTKIPANRSSLECLNNEGNEEYDVDRPLVQSQREQKTKNQKQNQRRRITTPTSSQQYDSLSNLSNDNENNSNSNDDDDNNLDCSANTILLQSWEEKDTTAPAMKEDSKNDNNDNLNVEYGKLEFLKQELEHKMLDTNHNITTTTTTTTTTDSPPPPPPPAAAATTTKGGGGVIIR